MNKKLKAAIILCSLSALPLISSADDPVGNTFTVEENYTGNGYTLVDEQGNTVSIDTAVISNKIKNRR